MPSARKSFDAEKSNSGRISFKISAVDFMSRSFHLPKHGPPARRRRNPVSYTHLLVHLFAASVAAQQNHFFNGRNFQKRKRLHQAEEKTGAALIDVEADHFVVQTKLALNHVARGRHRCV